MAKPRKIFVLDTNVILHDYKCIYHFEDNDIVLPIVVLEELDKLKKGSDLINFHAREFTRELDQISGDNLFSDGVELGEGKGRLFIETGKAYSKNLEASFPEHTPDHRILAITEFLKDKYTDRPVILVSKDINLRMKAKSLGIVAQDYRSDKVQDTSIFSKDSHVVDLEDDALIQKLYNTPGGVPVQEFGFKFSLHPHHYFILRNGNSTVLAHYDPYHQVIQRVDKQRCYGIEPRNAEQTFAFDALLRPEIALVAMSGKAGTGKTLLTLAAALQQEQQFNQIYLARPIVPLSNRDLGYLPGDINQKISPYMQPLFDNLGVIKYRFKPQSKEFLHIEELLKTEKLLIAPLAYIRGRSLSNVFFIVDEAQNLTPHEIKTIITRAGEGTKMVFTGDIQQIDSPYLDSLSNGLSYMADKMRGQNLFAHIHLVKGERSYLADLASNLL